MTVRRRSHHLTKNSSFAIQSVDLQSEREDAYTNQLYRQYVIMKQNCMKAGHRIGSSTTRVWVSPDMFQYRC